MAVNPSSSPPSLGCHSAAHRAQGAVGCAGLEPGHGVVDEEYEDPDGPLPW
ncbi:hypothetical protein GGTG_02977 [Gaeumannomyces tritici R3-111a-1]|uniref:Uncharacterized protein n=1 Tax=Gaeumannomyces tritici (strain R3-111a-1) TaxID=644352 RepID=J3NNX1_GAET3|nr:hypothetical protein GGTG_02977 [Gaeumannomyces tritici R3-111a-1]EJT77874.1 hypothetical protein GGTG_02977 [Gaeumannomyces tritici R3-111a-1]